MAYSRMPKSKKTLFLPVDFFECILKVDDSNLSNWDRMHLCEAIPGLSYQASSYNLLAKTDEIRERVTPRVGHALWWTESYRFTKHWIDADYQTKRGWHSFYPTYIGSAFQEVDQLPASIRDSKMSELWLRATEILGFCIEDWQSSYLLHFRLQEGLSKFISFCSSLQD